MKTFTIVLLVILVILIVACVALYFVGKKRQKRNRQISRHSLMQLHRLFPSWLSIKVV